MPETWPDQRIYIGKIQHIGCHNLIQDILKDKPEMSLHFTLGRLIEQLQEENHVLAFKEDTSIPHIGPHHDPKADCSQADRQSVQSRRP